MSALLIGTAIALGALAFVLAPLFSHAASPPTGAGRRPSAAGPDERERAVEALREIEFDRATGKLSDADYAALKAQYTQQAIDALRMASAPPPPAAVPASPRACARCGPRPEPGALYCSECGDFLDRQCAGCGAPVEQRSARYCSACGRRLAGVAA